MNTDMDLFELILFDVVILLIFICFLLTAVFFTDQNMFLILLSMVFGIATVPFAQTLGGWWTLLKTQEKCKLNISLDSRCAGWLCLDFGLKGNIRLFKVLSIATAAFSLYDLIRYFT